MRLVLSVTQDFLPGTWSVLGRRAGHGWRPCGCLARRIGGTDQMCCATIGWIHTVLGAVAVIPFNPKRTKNHTCLRPTCTRADLGKRSGIERFFGRVFLFVCSVGLAAA